MSRTFVPHLVCAALCAGVALMWWNARRTPSLGPEFQITGTYQSGMTTLGPQSATFTIHSDGQADITRNAGWWYPPRESRRQYDAGRRSYALTPHEVSSLRSALDASGVFGDWSAEEEYCDGSTWTFTLASGARSVDRTVSGVRAFDDVVRFLESVIRQAHVDLLIDARQVPDRYDLATALRPDAALGHLREVFGDHPPGWSWSRLDGK